jgi:ATP-dependent RNA helicase RhlE
MTFSDLKITRQFIDPLNDKGIVTPTEIQEKAIPVISGGTDVVGIAQTGTGKTLAYLLPIVMKIKYAQGLDPRALILVPTKELVLQIEKEIAMLVSQTDLRWVALYGGIGPKTQIETITNGVDLIVATPGRFLEIYAKRVLSTKQIKTVVLDECDRMMDMGFWPQLRDIQEKMPQKKQQLLFSATFPEKVQRIADNFLLFPHVIEVTPQATPASTVQQVLFKVPNNATKTEALVWMLQHREEMNRVMVFCKTKDRVTQLANQLEKSGIQEVKVIHSNKGQNARINALEEFKAGKVRVLVTTDVSARGIDVFEVSHVVNFNVPQHHEDYVHRIGRTGRAFKTGEAITFMDVSEVYHVRKIEHLMNQFIPTHDLDPSVFIHATSKEEMQEQNREIDRQKRIENPDFKGAFHEKKFAIKAKELSRRGSQAAWKNKNKKGK